MGMVGLKEVGEQKRVLRQEIALALKSMSFAQREEGSARACALLQAQEVWRRAETVLFFAPLPQEPDIWPLVSQALHEGKQAALPRFLETGQCYQACRITDVAADLCQGRFGIREPGQTCAVIPLDRLDLVLAPGIAFDLHGRRLGRGKGFYDRLLAAARGTLCGVGFDQQIVATVPVEAHDIMLNCILTPTRWVCLPAARGS